MTKLTAMGASALVLLSLPAAAQEPQPPQIVYEAYFQVTNLDEWNRLFREYSVPLLRQLQEEGAIQGWTLSQHHTGGSYNVRQAVRTYDWASIDTFWSEYLSRLDDAVPEETRDTWDRLSTAHRDEIWNIGLTNLSGRPTSHIYHSAFNIGFADQEEWNTAFEERTRPVLDELVEEELLGGYVVLNHNSGGAHNWRVMYFFEEWDRIDDFFGQFFSRIAERYPAEENERVGQLIRSHMDYVWVPVPAQANPEGQ